MNANELRELIQLKEAGHITEEEYEKAKKIYFDQYEKPSGDR